MSGAAAGRQRHRIGCACRAAVTGAKAGEAGSAPTSDPTCATAAAGDATEPLDSLIVALRYVEALVDDAPESTDLLVEAAGRLLVTLRLASMVVGLLDGDEPAEKRKSLAEFSLALQMVEVR
jgi:hypothetical protein